MECLQALQSPGLSSYVSTLALNNRTGLLKPLLNFRLTLSAVYTTKEMDELSNDPTVNYEGLRFELINILPEFECREALHSFFEAMDVKVEITDVTPSNDSAQPVSEVALTEQVHIIWTAFNRLLMIWRDKFPR